VQYGGIDVLPTILWEICRRAFDPVVAGCRELHDQKIDVMQDLPSLRPSEQPGGPFVEDVIRVSAAFHSILVMFVLRGLIQAHLQCLVVHWCIAEIGLASVYIRQKE